MVRIERIELSTQPWEGYILPLYDTREMEPSWGIEPQTSALRKRRSSQLS